MNYYFDFDSRRQRQTGRGGVSGVRAQAPKSFNILTNADKEYKQSTNLGDTDRYFDALSAHKKKLKETHDIFDSRRGKAHARMAAGGETSQLPASARPVPPFAADIADEEEDPVAVLCREGLVGQRRKGRKRFEDVAATRRSKLPLLV